MLQLLRDFLSDVGIGEKPLSRFDENDYRLAAAALLIHVMTIDGQETGAEQDKLRVLLKNQFELGEEAVAELIEAATAADREAVDLYGFTSLINRAMDRVEMKRDVAGEQSGDDA